MASASQRLVHKKHICIMYIYSLSFSKPDFPLVLLSYRWSVESRPKVHQLISRNGMHLESSTADGIQLKMGGIIRRFGPFGCLLSECQHRQLSLSVLLVLFPCLMFFFSIILNHPTHSSNIWFLHGHNL